MNKFIAIFISSMFVTSCGLEYLALLTAEAEKEQPYDEVYGQTDAVPNTYSSFSYAVGKFEIGKYFLEGNEVVRKDLDGKEVSRIPKPAEPTEEGLSYPQKLEPKNFGSYISGAFMCVDDVLSNEIYAYVRSKTVRKNKSGDIISTNEQLHPIKCLGEIEVSIQTSDLTEDYYLTDINEGDGTEVLPNDVSINRTDFELTIYSAKRQPVKFAQAKDLTAVKPNKNNEYSAEKIKLEFKSLSSNSAQ